MSDDTQTKLLNILTLAIFWGLLIPIKKSIRNRVPSKRSYRDDASEALLHATARVVAVMIASGIIRRLAQQ